MAKPTQHLQVNGVEEATERLTNLATTLKGFNRTVAVGSRLPYAYGQETGRHRVSGKRARRSGPTYYLTFGVQKVLDQVDDDLITGLEKTMRANTRRPFTGLSLVRRIGRWAAKEARKLAPRQSGRLRRSIFTQVRR